MGSSKSSQATNQTDNRRVIGEGAISAENSSITTTDATASGNGIVAQHGASVTVLDNGAINKAFDFSNSIGRQAFDFGTQALDFGLSSQASSAKVLSDAYAEAKGRGAMTDYIIIGALAMAGLVAFQAVKK